MFHSTWYDFVRSSRAVQFPKMRLMIAASADDAGATSGTPSAACAVTERAETKQAATSSHAWKCRGAFMGRS